MASGNRRAEQELEHLHEALRRLPWIAAERTRAIGTENLQTHLRLAFCSWRNFRTPEDDVCERLAGL